MTLGHRRFVLPSSGWLRRARRPGPVAVLVLAAVALVLLSPAFGRADPTGNYRPPLPEDALTNGCWPLPGGARLDFGYQVRSDRVVGLRGVHGGRQRVLVLHYDEIDAGQVRSRVRRAFDEAGVAPGRWRLRVEPMADLPEGSLVRGTATLTLPPSTPDERREECRNPFSTKDFPPPLPESLL